MNLRELVIERICYAVDEQTLIRDYGLSDKCLESLSDLDLLELYEDVVFIDVVE